MLAPPPWSDALRSRGRAGGPTDGRAGRQARWRRLRAPRGKSVITTTVSGGPAVGDGRWGKTGRGGWEEVATEGGA